MKIGSLNNDVTMAVKLTHALHGKGSTYHHHHHYLMRLDNNA